MPRSPRKRVLTVGKIQNLDETCPVSRNGYTIEEWVWEGTGLFQRSWAYKRTQGGWNGVFGQSFAIPLVCFLCIWTRLVGVNKREIGGPNMREFCYSSACIFEDKIRQAFNRRQ